MKYSNYPHRKVEWWNQCFAGSQDHQLQWVFMITIFQQYNWVCCRYLFVPLFACLPAGFLRKVVWNLTQQRNCLALAEVCSLREKTSWVGSGLQYMYVLPFTGQPLWAQTLVLCCSNISLYYWISQQAATAVGYQLHLYVVTFAAHRDFPFLQQRYFYHGKDGKIFAWLFRLLRDR